MVATASCTFLYRIANPRGEICDGTFAIEVETGILSGYTPRLRITFCTRVVRTHVGAAAGLRAVIENRVLYVLW